MGIGSTIVEPRLEQPPAADMCPAQRESGTKPSSRKRRRQNEHGEGASSHGEPLQHLTTINDRKRALVACQVCRARKVKCSNERPTCAGCTRLGCDCIYPEVASYNSNIHTQENGPMIKTLQEILKRLPPTSLAGRIHDASDSYVGESPPFTALDYMFQWPIFSNNGENSFPHANILAADHLNVPGRPQSHHARVPVLDGDEVGALLTRFLRLVHVMNPILDCTNLIRYGTAVAEFGPQWDAKTCLVFVAMALGAIAKPLESGSNVTEPPTQSSPWQNDSQDWQRAEMYYQYARRRFGVLGRSLMACQCHFIAGVYLLFSLKPVQAWQAFFHASSTLTVYLKSRAALQNVASSQVDDDDMVGDEYCSDSELRSCLEQRLYWSCIKAESELCAEIELPRSGLYSIDYPYQFPSPPTPRSIDGLQEPHAISAMGFYVPSDLLSGNGAAAGRDFKRLHEHSWFYYLSEIALLRISSRVNHEFYSNQPSAWANMNLLDMVNAASDFEKQLLQWQHTLPTAISCFQQPIDLAMVTELQLATWTRCASIKLRLYRPFLYRLALEQEQDWPLQDTLTQLAEKAVLFSLDPLFSLGLRHRHAASWFRCRETASRMMILICAKRIGLIAQMHLEHRQQTTFKDCLTHLRLWEEEAEDIRLARKVLETMSSP